MSFIPLRQGAGSKVDGCTTTWCVCARHKGSQSRSSLPPTATPPPLPLPLPDMSRFGTYVNDERLTPGQPLVQLKDGDIIKLGNRTVFR